MADDQSQQTKPQEAQPAPETKAEPAVSPVRAEPQYPSDYDDLKRRNAEYEQQIGRYRGQEDQWRRDRDQVARWNGFYRSLFGEHYGDDTNRWAQDLKEKFLPLITKKPSKPSPIQDVGDDEWLTAKQAREWQEHARQELLDEAKAAVAGLVRGEFDQGWQRFNPWLAQQFQALEQKVMQELLNKRMPQALNIYDRTAAVRAKRKDDPDFKLEELVDFMDKNGILDPDEADQRLYGERYRKREIEQIKKDALEQARKELAEQATAQSLQVLGTGGRSGGFFPRGNGEAAPKDDREATQAALRVLQEKYGSRIF